MSFFIKNIFNLFIGPKPVLYLFNLLLNNSIEKKGEYHSILVVRLDAIGDFILFSPFLRELKINNPNSKITLIVNPAVFNLAELCPYVDNVKVFNCKTRSFFPKLELFLKSIKFSISNLWPNNYDLAILPRWDVDYFFASYLILFSKARKRIAFSEKVNNLKRKLNKNYDLFFTNLIEFSGEVHEVNLNLILIEYLGFKISSNKLEVWINNQDEIFGNTTLNQWRNFFIVAIAPGAIDKNRQWPVYYFKQLVEELILKFNFKIIILGGNNEIALGKEISDNFSQDSIIDLTGKTSIRQAASLLKKCNLYVGNDTGLKHIAAASGITVFEISRFHINGYRMHGQSPYRFHAWGVSNFIFRPNNPIDNCSDDCLYDFPHCITQVAVNDVIDEISNLRNK